MATRSEENREGYGYSSFSGSFADMVARVPFAVLLRGEIIA